jgi:hypothetical protein
MKSLLSTILFFSLFASACLAANESLSPSERGRLGTAMVNLSATVDTVLSERKAPPVGDDLEIIRAAVSYDPSLLTPAFDGYKLRLKWQKSYAVLLLCDREGRFAYMEDAGCSARLDRQAPEGAPCEFALKVLPNCQVEGGDAQ